jgi:RNAse (barnase) inhibitor barstar
MSRAPFTREPGAVADAADRARTRAVTVGLVGHATDRPGVLAAMADALSFPASTGRNLDALEDALRDLTWLPEGPVTLVWDDAPLRAADPGAHRTVLSILRSAVDFQVEGPHPLEVVLVG